MPTLLRRTGPMPGASVAGARPSRTHPVARDLRPHPHLVRVLVHQCDSSIVVQEHSSRVVSRETCARAAPRTRVHHGGPGSPLGGWRTADSTMNERSGRSTPAPASQPPPLSGRAASSSTCTTACAGGGCGGWVVRVQGGGWLWRRGGMVRVGAARLRCANTTSPVHRARQGGRRRFRRGTARGGRVAGEASTATLLGERNRPRRTSAEPLDRWAEVRACGGTVHADRRVAG